VNAGDAGIGFERAQQFTAENDAGGAGDGEG
jgi:hypothetical protein